MKKHPLATLLDSIGLKPGPIPKMSKKLKIGKPYRYRWSLELVLVNVSRKRPIRVGVVARLGFKKKTDLGAFADRMCQEHQGPGYIRRGR